MDRGTRAQRAGADRADASAAEGYRGPAGRTGTAVADRAVRRRLLIPLDATERSRWALRYALAHRDRVSHVDLLFVAEPVTSLEVLRFRTQADIAAFQQQTARWLLEDAAQALQAAGISVASHFREGDVPRQIVQTAEELGDDAIVLPPPHRRWLNFLTRGIVRRIVRHARATPIVHVDHEGAPIAAQVTASVAP